MSSAENCPKRFRDYILVNTIGNTKFRETTASFNVDGPLFALPGGDVQLALGANTVSKRLTTRLMQTRLAVTFLV